MNYYQALDELRKIKGLSSYEYNAAPQEAYSPLARIMSGISERDNTYLTGSVTLSGVTANGVEVTVTIYLNELKINNEYMVNEVKRIFEG